MQHTDWTRMPFLAHAYWNMAQYTFQEVFFYWQGSRAEFQDCLRPSAEDEIARGQLFNSAHSQFGHKSPGVFCHLRLH